MKGINIALFILGISFVASFTNNSLIFLPNPIGDPQVKEDVYNHGSQANRKLLIAFQENIEESAVKTVYSDKRAHCIDHFLAVKYDGKGNVYIGGAGSNRKIHTNRKDCGKYKQGWVKVLKIGTTNVASLTINSYGKYGSKKCGGVISISPTKKIEKVFTGCAWNGKGAQYPLVKTVVNLKMKQKTFAYPIRMTVDNVFDLYVNGKLVGRGNSWTTTYSFNPQIDKLRSVAIAGRDKGGPAAFIGTFGGKITKAREWKCMDYTKSKVPSNWMTDNFDDRKWPVAKSYGKNSDNNVWRRVAGKVRPNIPNNAEWIWSKDNENSDMVYCRLQIAKPQQQKPQQKSAEYSKLEADKKRIDKIVEALNKNKKLSLKKLGVLGTKVNKVLEDSKRNELKQLEVELRNIERTGKSVKKVYQDFTAKINEVNRLKVNIGKLKEIVKKHFAQMTKDSKYLQLLKLIKPKYFDTLRQFNAKMDEVGSSIKKNIVAGEDKKGMLRIVDKSKGHANNITEWLSKAFLEHYEKYKNLLTKETSEYEAEQKKLAADTNKYNTGVKLANTYEREYKRLLDILNKLKVTYGQSKEEQAVFEEVIKVVQFIFRNPAKIKSFYDGELVNGKCAKTILQTHIKNELI